MFLRLLLRVVASVSNAKTCVPVSGTHGSKPASSGMIKCRCVEVLLVLMTLFARSSSSKQTLKTKRSKALSVGLFDAACTLKSLALAVKAELDVHNVVLNQT
jgi:hypothetical protein